MGSLTGFAHAALHDGRALAAAALTAGLLRLVRPGWVAGSAVAAGVGWIVLSGPLALAPPHTAIAALPGLALLAAAAAVAQQRWPGAGAAIELLALPLAAAWWLRGAKLSHEVVQIVPLCLGLAAAMALLRRWRQRAAPSWMLPAASAAFALALLGCGGRPAWIVAAGVPGAVALVFWGSAPAAAPLGTTLLLASAALVLAADRGRLNAFDAAAALPLLCLWLLPKLGVAAPARRPGRTRARRPPRRQPKATSLN